MQIVDTDKIDEDALNENFNDNDNIDSRWPALRGLNSKQGEHCRGHIVVVELLLTPFSGHHLKSLSCNHWPSPEQHFHGLQSLVSGFVSTVQAAIGWHWSVC